MGKDISAALTRIDQALSRIEAQAGHRHGSATDGRYERLRTRTQAALAQLDQVIARMSRDDAR